MSSNTGAQVRAPSGRRLFCCAVSGGAGGTGLSEPRQVSGRIDPFTTVAQLDMNVRPGRAAGRSDAADLLAGRDTIALLEAGGNETCPTPQHGLVAAPNYFNYRKTSIYAGSNEIQWNIMAKMVLGL